MENFFKKSIKKLATGAAFVGALAGSPEKADGQVIGVDKDKIKEKIEVPAYHTTNPKDPRIQDYKDSLQLYNNHPNTKIDLDINSKRAKGMTDMFYDNDSNKPIGYSSEKTGINIWYTPVYKKPVQEVILDQLPKGPIKYNTTDKAGNKYYFMTDSVVGSVRSVTERAYNSDYKNLPEVKYEDLKRIQEGK